MSPAGAAGAGPPRVAVIVPVHDKAEYVTEALESVAAQTYEDWELVVVNDASSDDSGRLIDAFAVRNPEKVTAIHLEENAGPADARNAAIAASHGGELIALLDADDRWLPNYLDRQVATLDAASAAGRRPGIAACNALIEIPDGITGRFDELFWWADEITYELMLERSYILVCATFLRAAYDEVGGFSPECWGSEDYDLWLRIMERGYEVVTNREPLAVYRHHPAGLSANDLTMADAGLDAYRRALDRPGLTPAQRRLVRTRQRHYRALRERALLAGAWRERHPAGIVVHAARALPLGLVAVLQSPRRWREWISKRGNA